MGLIDLGGEKMKMKEVRFEKLFSLEKYHNERIGFTAEVEEGESADKVAGELHFKIMDIEDCLQAYRTVLSRLEYASDRFGSKQSEIRHLQDEMKDHKIKIAELAKQIKTGDVDAKLQRACSRESYKSMQERLGQYEKELEDLDNQIKGLTESKLKLRERIKNGEFSTEGLEIPQVRRRYHEY